MRAKHAARWCLVLLITLPCLMGRAGVVSGTLSSNATWTPDNSPYVITGSFTVATGAELTLNPGTQVQLNSNGLLRINGSLYALGSSAQTVTVTRMTSNNVGGRLVVQGGRQGDALTSTLRLDHCSFSYLTWTSPCVIATYHTDVNVTHSKFDTFGSTVMILTSSRVHVANNLFTNTGECVNSVYGYGEIISNKIHKMNGYADGIDLDLAWTNTGSAAYLTDIGWNELSNDMDPDADALDLGVAYCVVHDNIIDQFGDKGISIGEYSSARVFNNVISRCHSGIVVKDYSNPVMYNNTIVACDHGELSHQKYWGPGAGSLSNSIIWNCVTNIHLENGSTLAVGNCIMNGTIWTGPGNTNLNPQFVNPAARNYALQSNSPAIDAANPETSSKRDVVATPRPLDGNANGTALPDLGAYEFVHAQVDSDGDHMPDAWEVPMGINAATNDLLEDIDGDGADNWREYMADTDPDNQVSSLRILDVTQETNAFQITWQGGLNSRQVLYFSSNILNFDGPWIPLYTNNPPTATNVTLTIPMTSTKGRFRIGAVRQ